jgi:signal transduction histidine kinase
MRVDRLLRVARTSWVDIAWVAFIVLNLLAMRLLPGWQTVPFLIIWVSLTAIYGFRLWRLGSTLVTVLTVTLATGGLIGWQVLRGKQDADYLAEVPLLAMMFVVMVWHSRRRIAALEDMRRVSEHNMLLLERQRKFLQDASHELGTPITIALGHAELIEQAATDQSIARDARVAVDELLRMRRLTSRMLLLAASDGPDFLSTAPVERVKETRTRVNCLPHAHRPMGYAVPCLACSTKLAAFCGCHTTNNSAGPESLDIRSRSRSDLSCHRSRQVDPRSATSATRTSGSGMSNDTAP